MEQTQGFTCTGLATATTQCPTENKRTSSLRHRGYKMGMWNSGWKPQARGCFVVGIAGPRTPPGAAMRRNHPRPATRWGALRWVGVAALVLCALVGGVRGSAGAVAGAGPGAGQDDTDGSGEADGDKTTLVTVQGRCILLFILTEHFGLGLGLNLFNRADIYRILVGGWQHEQCRKKSWGKWGGYSCTTVHNG